MATFIKIYGEFWNPDIVDWGTRGAGNKGKFTGKIKVERIKNGRKSKKNEEVDFWEGRGIYVLFDNFVPVYVGKALSVPIGKRIRDHLSDRFAGRWDMFSWYSTSNYNKTTNKLSRAGSRSLTEEAVINSLEAIAILISDPRLNRKRETLPKAYEAIQEKSPHPHTIRHYLEEISSKLDSVNSGDQKVDAK